MQPSYIAIEWPDNELPAQIARCDRHGTSPDVLGVLLISVSVLPLMTVAERVRRS
jgi:hypothetical protein